MRSTPVQWRDKHNRDVNKVTEDTKSGSYTVQRLTSPLHDDKRATTPRQQGNLRLTHFKRSQYTWSRNQGNVTSSHAADSVTLVERVGNSKSRPWSMIHMNCDRCSQIQQRVAPSSTGLSQHRWYHCTHVQIHTPQNPSSLRLISPAAHSLVGHDSSSQENCYGSGVLVCVGPACPRLP